MTAAVYLRVSTDKQTTENQEPAVRQLVEARGGAGAWEAATVYRETKSAVKVRPEFDRMMEDARLGRFRTLYVWALDRFGRSMFDTLRDLRTLIERYNVAVVSVRESWLDTGDQGHRRLLLGIFSWVAQHERERLQQRTNAGLDRVRAGIAAGGHRKLVKRLDGTTEVKVVTALGRPRVTIPDRALDKAAELRAAGLAWRPVAAELKRLGFGAWKAGTLARECPKRVATAAGRGPRTARPSLRSP